MKFLFNARSAMLGLMLAMAGLSLAGCEMPNEVLRRQALDAMEQRDMGRADARLRRALVQDPADWRANLYLAKLRLQQNRALEAQSLAEHAYKQNPAGPDTPEILDTLAESLYQQGDKPALAQFLSGTATLRKNPSDYLRQARYLGKIGDSDGVNLAFIKAAKFAAPDDPRPYLEAAMYYQIVGEQERVVTNLRHAYYCAPESVVVWEKMRAAGLAPGPGVGLPPLSGLN